jgi:hypothetical protein
VSPAPVVVRRMCASSATASSGWCVLLRDTVPDQDGRRLATGQGEHHSSLPCLLVSSFGAALKAVGSPCSLPLANLWAMFSIGNRS